MKSTREKILRTLLTYPGSTINDLASAVGINGISVRHHLTALEAENLVTSSEERHGVGRPRLVYSLTEKGVEEFPTNYLRLTQRIINTLDRKLSPGELKSIFETIGAEIADPYQQEITDKSLEERLTIVRTAMTNEGFIVEIKKDVNFYILSSLSCPYYQVGVENPVVCSLDQTLISKLIGFEVESKTCIFEGHNRCTFHIPIES